MFRVAQILGLSFVALAFLALTGIAIPGSANQAAAGQFSGSGGRAFHGKVSIKHSYRAGKFSRKFHHRHLRRHSGSRRFATGKRWRHNRRYEHPAASSGVMLGKRVGYGPRRLVLGRKGHRHHHRAWSGRSGPKIIHVRKGDWRDAKRDRHDSRQRVTIVVGGQAVERIDGARGNAPRIEGGSCASDTYCTVRLGPYANSPKIITLNTSGRTLSNELID